MSTAVHTEHSSRSGRIDWRWQPEWQVESCRTLRKVYASGQLRPLERREASLWLNTASSITAPSENEGPLRTFSWALRLVSSWSYSGREWPSDPPFPARPNVVLLDLSHRPMTLLNLVTAMRESDEKRPCTAVWTGYLTWIPGYLSGVGGGRRQMSSRLRCVRTSAKNTQALHSAQRCKKPRFEAPVKDARHGRKTGPIVTSPRPIRCLIPNGPGLAFDDGGGD